MLKIRTLLLMNAIIFLGAFVAGLIHPYAVLIFNFIEAYLGLFAIVIFFITFVKLIRGFFKPQKRIFANLTRVTLCVSMYSFFIFSFHICFAGLRLHYWFIKDYTSVRDWMQNVESLMRGCYMWTELTFPNKSNPFILNM